MSTSVFSVPIFFIAFRETIEAAIIISVLLGLVENLVDRSTASAESTMTDETLLGEESAAGRKKRLVRRMKLQIWAGALVGLFIAVCIGAAFIAVFFTTLSDIWSKTEEIWEGVFSIIACIIIFFMGLTMLRIDRSKLKWQKKLERAFDNKKTTTGPASEKDIKEGKSSKWTLFLLPMITVLREGLEAVVFIGGVSLGQSAKAIPLAAIVGIICGLIVGYIIYASGSRVNLSIFLVVSTNILFLLGAGLFSKSVGYFQTYKFNKGVGGDVSETGSGPGSYDVHGNVWHLTYGNPEDNFGNGGYAIFNAILGWTNNATIGTILAYVFYWLAVTFALVYMKWSEGRVSFFGVQSAAGKRRQARMHREANRSVTEKDPSLEGSEGALKKEVTPEEHNADVVV